MAGVKGKSGPKPGNKNALKNGSKVNRLNLVIGTLPSRFRTAQKQAREYRRKMVEGIQEAKGDGDLDALDLHQIDLGAQCTAEESILRQLLRDRHETMKPSEIAALLKQVRDSKQVRIQALRQLRESIIPTNPWEQLYDEEVEDEQADA